MIGSRWFFHQRLARFFFSTRWHVYFFFERSWSHVVFLPNLSVPFGPPETSFRMKRAWTHGDKPKANAIVEEETVAALFFCLQTQHVVFASQADKQQVHRGRDGVHWKYFITTVIAFSSSLLIVTLINEFMYSFK